MAKLVVEVCDEVLRLRVIAVLICIIIVCLKGVCLPW